MRHFTQALQNHRGDMDYSKFWRYTKGSRPPRLLLWLLDRPDLVQALALDAQERASSIQPNEAGVADESEVQ